MEENEISFEEVIANFQSQASKSLSDFNAKYDNEINLYKKKFTEIENEFTAISDYDEQCQQK